MSELLARAGWADWSVEPTCKAANSSTLRRQDQVWLSSEMQVRLESVNVSWSSGLATHALQEGRFQRGDPDSFKAWVLGDSGPEETEAGFTGDEFEASLNQASWTAAERNGDVDGLWRLLEGALCQAHSARSPGFSAPAARVATQSEEVRRSFGGDLVDKALTQATQRKRRLQHWLAGLGKPSCAKQQAALRRALAADPDPCWAGIALLTLPREAVEELVQRARSEEDKIREELREHRRLGYRSWCMAESEGGMKALFRWVKDGPRSLQSSGIFLKEGRLFAGQRALLEASEQAWWPLWRPSTKPTWSRVVPPRAAAAWEPADFEAWALMRLVKTMCCAKAPGHDGWSVGRMRQWPLVVWQFAVALFKVVEHTGRWPEALRGGVICLLPKAGAQATTNSPLEARPVVLLPLLYRLWAYKRGREIGQWLVQHGMDGLPDGSRSAEAYGLLLAAELEQATFLDEPLLAVCTDQSKAYDMVDLELLQFLLERSGMPGRVWKPMMSMATAPRRIKVMRAVGEWQEPTSGMLPGCPGATFLMCYLLERWRRFTTAVGPQTWARSWVDDTTAAGQGITAELATMVASTRAMEDLEQGDGLKVNRPKSGVLVSHKILANLVHQIHELRSQSLYGVVVGCGEVQPPAWEHQWREQLQAAEATSFVWHNSEGDEQPGRDLRAVAAVATVWLCFDREPPEPVAELVRANRGVWLLVRGMHGLEAAAVPASAPPPLCEPPGPQQGSASIEEARACLRRDSDPQRWARGPPLVLHVKAVIKDLGVSQGIGKEAKDLQAKRARVAFDRLGRVARLGLPRAKLGRLAGCSALTAGLFGAAAHVYDTDTLPAMRRWVMHALYKGSHFAQLRLFMHLVLPCKSADPCRVALRKGWEACELIRGAWGQDKFVTLWNAPSGDGPVHSFKLLLDKVLHPFGAETSEDFLAGGAVWRSKGVAAELLDAALERADLHRVSTHRKGLQGAEDLDVQAARALALRLQAGGPREAFESVMIGDMVVRGLTRHWQQHDGQCLCSRGRETVEHSLWDCPRYVSERQGAERCGAAAVSHLPPVHRRLGAPLKEPALVAWVAQQTEQPAVVRPVWRAEEVFADASGLHPKDPAIRGLVGGVWQKVSGHLPIGASVCAGEAAAAACAVAACSPGGTVITDCKAVLHMWVAIRARRKGATRKALAGSCWQSLAEALEDRLDVHCKWMPSHLSPQQLVSRGWPAGWHAGNDEADKAAKAAARSKELPAALLASHRQHLELASRVSRTVAAIQLKRLKGRARTAMGSAAKERVRKQPGLPRRLRARGVKRARPAASAGALPVQGLVVRGAGDLLQLKAGEWPEDELVQTAVLEDAPCAEGVHDMRPLGPWPLAGSGAVKDGRLAGLWLCGRCGKRASDTSRVVELAKKPCLQAVWSGTPARHELVPLDSGGSKCSRCGLAVRPQHEGQCSHAACPVPQVARDGVPWPAGEASIRSVLGRVKGYRRWCCPRDAAMQPQANVQLPSAVPLLVVHLERTEAEPGAKRARVDPDVGSDPPRRLQAYAGHWSMHLGRGLRCIRCFERPSGDYRAWKQGRCLDLLPLHSMPCGMERDVLRAEPPGVGTPVGMCSRFASLAECARQRPAIRSLAAAAVRRVGPHGHRQAGLGDTVSGDPVPG